MMRDHIVVNDTLHKDKHAEHKGDACMASSQGQSAGRFWAHGCAEQYTPRDAANVRIFSAWVVAWTFSFGIATVLLGKHVVTALPAAVAVAVLPTLLGIATVRAFLRFLREADELVRKIQMEALGWGFGAGAIFALGYRLFERIGAPRLDVAAPFIVMMAATAVGQYVGRRRYL
jgi:hypothetical protein